MNKLSLIIILSLAYCTVGVSQSMTTIFTNVDTLLQGSSIGSLSISSKNATPVVSSSLCSKPQRHYSVATEYRNGKVIAIGHEGLLADRNIILKDNLQFVMNAIKWLNPGKKRVSLKEGWIYNGNSSILQKELKANDYTISTQPGDISNTSLANTDILILGNDWNGEEPYLRSELSAIENFVANGGAVFITGLGWSYPRGLDQYPMNAVAKMFGFEYTKDIIYDQSANIDGAPLLYTFFPNNINTTGEPYCPSWAVGSNLKRGDNLRVLRLAVSSTGEFTRESGGVKATTRLIDEWLEKMNEMYGREYCVRFELIPDNYKLIFSNPNTDPWGTLPAGSGGCTNVGIIMDKQASVIDDIIGEENYDISHVVLESRFNGGCGGGLKNGVSGGLNIGVTRHEIGHQLAQSHTINYSDKNNYEPENGGWTVQGGNRYGYAHGISYHQLANLLKKDIPTKGNKVPTGNSVPKVDAGSDYIIPISTPFTLTGTATDADANDKLTYVWDNMSLGIPQKIPVADDSQGALFMRLMPTETASRTFPKMEDVIANKNANEQEQLPTQPRIMDIRLTVNDNHKIRYKGNQINASGINSDDVQIIVADAGPLVVTSQNRAGISYRGGSSQVVTWDVNGTDRDPINTEMVMISLSVDGGYTYPYILYAFTPNTGYIPVFIPEVSTTSARIKVTAIDNIYFDINTHDFEIRTNSSRD